MEYDLNYSADVQPRLAGNINLNTKSCRLLELRKEFPGFIRRPSRVLALIGWSGSVTSIILDPGDGVALFASYVLGLHMCPAPHSRRGDVLRRAAVVLDKPVADGMRSGNVQIPVYSMLAVEGNGIIATGAAAHVPTRLPADGAEFFGQTAGECVRHGGTIAEADREEQVLVDAQICLGRLVHLADESDVLAVAVGPAAVQTIRVDVDGAHGVLHKIGHAIPGQVASLAGSHHAGVAASRVQREDQAVGVLVVVGLRQLDEIPAFFSIRGHGVNLVRSEGRF